MGFFWEQKLHATRDIEVTMVFSPLKRGLASARAGARPWTAYLLPITCLLAAPLVGCDDDSDSTALPGELGSNEFFYDCSTLDDIQCREDLTAFPDFIAVGASFELNASPDFGSSLFIKPASPRIVSAAAGEFRFLEPGFSAFLAIDDDDELRDFVHLEAVPVDEIQVEGSFGQRVTEITLAPGRVMTLIAVPFGDDAELAGSLSFRWSTDQETVVRVPRRGTEVRLEALEEGTALVRVELDQVEALIQVTVTEAESEPTDAGGNSDANTDAGALDAAVVEPQDAALDLDSSVSPLDAAVDTASSAASDTSSSTPTDASTPTDSSDTPDAQVQAEAGDQ